MAPKKKSKAAEKQPEKKSKTAEKHPEKKRTSQPGTTPVNQPPPRANSVSAPVNQPSPWKQTAASGLGVLKNVDKLCINAMPKAEGGKNRIEILDSSDQKLFIGQEHACCLVRNKCRPTRPFTLEITDSKDNKFLFLKRPCRCSALCCCHPMFQQRIVLESPKGTRIGRVRQVNSCLKPYFLVEDDDNEEMFRIKGPCCLTCRGSRNTNFRIQAIDGSADVGLITKSRAGQTSRLIVTFPDHLDPKIKATFLGAAVLFNFLY